MITSTALNQLVPQILTLAQRAGEQILQVASKPNLNITAKEDASPVTEADLSAHHCIHNGLLSLTPDIPQLSEEAAHIPFHIRRNWSTYWLIDPLDGTKEFIANTGEYSVNIALIEEGVPVLGVIYLPVSQQSYFAYKHGGSFCIKPHHAAQPIHTRQWLSHAPVITLSRRHKPQNPALHALLSAVSNHEKMLAGSSYKFCLLAEGKADIYPRFSATSEWDTAAGQIILEEAGGAVWDLFGKPLRYNTKESLVNPPFFAIADTTQNWETVLTQIRALL